MHGCHQLGHRALQRTKLAVTERDRDRAPQQILEVRVPHLECCAPGQRVLDNAILDVLRPKSPSQILKLAHSQAAVVGKHRGLHIFQFPREELDLFYLLWSCHQKTSVPADGHGGAQLRSKLPRQEIKAPMTPPAVSGVSKYTGAMDG